MENLVQLMPLVSILELELENSLFDTYKYTYIIYEKEHVIEEATQVQSGD